MFERVYLDEWSKYTLKFLNSIAFGLCFDDTRDDDSLPSHNFAN